MNIDRVDEIRKYIRETTEQFDIIISELT